MKFILQILLCIHFPVPFYCTCQYHIQTDEGDERFFRYQTDNGQFRRERILKDGTVVGSYGWVDANKILRLYDYVADQQGYRIVRTRIRYVEDVCDEKDPTFTQVASTTRSQNQTNLYHEPTVISEETLREKYELFYNTGSQFHYENTLADGTRVGKHGYIDPFGILRIVHYTAGSRGYRTLDDIYQQVDKKISFNSSVERKYFNDVKSGIFNRISNLMYERRITKTPFVTATKLNVTNQWSPEKISALGFSFGARKAERFPVVKQVCPAPNVYSMKVLSSTKRYNVSFIPTVGQKKMTRKTIRKKMIPICLPNIKIQCSPYQMNLCALCADLPLGDYWECKQFSLCTKCYYIMKLCEPKNYQFGLNKLQKTRHCTEYHHHDGTNAYITKMTQKELIKQINKEKYFRKFFANI